MSKKLIYIFTLLPIIDLFTALCTRNGMNITPGLIAKGIFLIIEVLYLLFNKSKYKKINLLCLLFIFIYICLYFAFKTDVISFKYLLNEMSFISKLIFFPISFLCFLSYCEEYKINKVTIIKILIINGLLYLLLLLIPLILNSAYSTYPQHLKGTIGWYYSGNEISVIVNLLFPIILLLTKYHKSLFIIPILFSFISIYIGTKVATIGIFILTILYFIFSLFKKENKKSSVIILLCTIMFVINSNAIYNNNYRMNHNLVENEIEIDESQKEKVNEIEKKLEKFYSKNEFNRTLSFLLNGRDKFLANTISIYNDNININKVLFGIGFSNTSKINNSNITKLIEIDFLDIYFHFGIIGLIIIFIPYIIVLTLLLKNKIKFNAYFSYLIILIFLIFGIANFGGHVFFYPAVSIYLSFYLILILYNQDIIKNSPKKRKVSFLALHLGYGGIEKTICDQANMLSNYIDVEIACLYKSKMDIPYNLNKKVKVNYLSNLWPNRDKVNLYLNNKNYLKLIKELLISSYILFQKKRLITKYILDSDSKIIISTRVEFTKILNKLKDKDTVTISEEHNYHNNNKKYLSAIKNSLNNIDYFMPSSKYLYNFYKAFLKNMKVKVKYMPLTIDYIPPRKSSLNNNKIISVGRFSPEKGFDDLIEVMNIVVKKNKKIKLILVGDGEEKETILNMINEFKLNKNITLTGYLNQIELRKEYQKASLYVMPSHYESFGLVLLEAMSYNIPCFAFDSALGAKEIINKENGIIVKNRNISKMANEIVNYFNVSNSYNPKKTAEKYYTENVKILWKNFIENIIGE